MDACMESERSWPSDLVDSLHMYNSLNEYRSEKEKKLMELKTHELSMTQLL